MPVDIISRIFIWLICPFVLLSGCSQEEASHSKFTGNMVLAISWQPAFCETRPRLPECKSQIRSRFDASHFTLHGLWPQPGSNVYCGVDENDRKKDKSRRWKKLTGLGLSDDLEKALWKIMPGVRSFLHRHEWIKHGSCYSSEAQTYYDDSIALMDLINASPVRDQFAASIGETLKSSDIRATFDRTFGAGAGDRVRIACKRDGRRMLITEITIGLSGEISTSPNLGQLILASPRTKPGCSVGMVDAVGLQ